MVKQEIVKDTGSESNIRMLQQKSTILIKDIYCWTTREGLLDAINVVVEGHGAEIQTLRPTYGSQPAVVLLPLDVAKKIVEKEHLIVGLVCCRVRWG